MIKRMNDHQHGYHLVEDHCRHTDISILVDADGLWIGGKGEEALLEWQHVDEFWKLLHSICEMRRAGNIEGDIEKLR